MSGPHCFRPLAMISRRKSGEWQKRKEVRRMRVVLFSPLDLYCPRRRWWGSLCSYAIGRRWRIIICYIHTYMYIRIMHVCECVGMWVEIRPRVPKASALQEQLQTVNVYIIYYLYDTSCSGSSRFYDVFRCIELTDMTWYNIRV